MNLNKTEKWTFNAVSPSFFLPFFFLHSCLFSIASSNCFYRSLSFEEYHFSHSFKVTSRKGYRLNNSFHAFFFFFFKVSFNQKYHVHVINICSLQKYPRSSKKRWKFVSNLFTIKSRFSKIFSKTPRLLLNYTQ